MEWLDTITSSPWFQIFNWLGPVLVVLSLTLKRVLLFRWVNLAGSLISAIALTMTRGWPFVAMNTAIVLINIFWLRKLYSERNDAAAYSVVPVAHDDGMMRHLLDTNAADIAQNAPRFSPELAPGEQRTGYLVLKGNETVGAVQVADGGNGVGNVLLDWVAPKYRDFAPGQFVYQQSGIFAQQGFNKLVVPEGVAPTSADYLQKVGFVRDGTSWVRAV